MCKIKITYSWGDCEDPDQYGQFLDEESAYYEMCRLAAQEAYVYNEEFKEERTCEVYFDGFNKKVDLHYVHDNTWCYYEVIKED